MLLASFDTLKEAGCIQCESEILRRMFHLLMAISKSDPCTKCPAFHGGKCKVYQQYHSIAINQKSRKEKQLKKATVPNNGTGRWANMSMKQIAQTEGISLNEARRRKAAGAYSNG